MVRTGQVAKAPVSNLHVVGSDKGTFCHAKLLIPATVSWGIAMECPIRSVDAGHIAIRMTHGEMGIINLSNPPVPDLNSHVTKDWAIAPGGTRHTVHVPTIEIRPRSGMKRAGATKDLGSLEIIRGDAKVRVGRASFAGPGQAPVTNLDVIPLTFGGHGGWCS